MSKGPKYRPHGRCHTKGQSESVKLRLYEAFDPEEAHRLRDKLELHYTPKHGSWLNVAEIGFSILKRQCIPFRVADINVLRNTVKSFIAQRNAEKRVVNWQFTTSDARIKLRHLYPEL